MDKTDKVIHLLLATGIAILFPVLVYFSVLTLLPSGKQPAYPSYPQSPSEPFCDSPTYDQYTGTYQTNTTFQCQQQKDRYQQKLNEYNLQVYQYEQNQKQFNANLDKYNRRTQSDRAVAAIIIALLAIGFSAYMRKAKELAGGLVAGSTLIIVVSISAVIGYMGTNKKDVPAVFVITLAFAVLTFMLYFLDKALPAAAKPMEAAGHPQPAFVPITPSHPQQTSSAEVQPQNPVPPNPPAQ